MDALLVRDVRCFKGETLGRLAPLTFLIGENSTGKSTFLALARVAWDIAYGVTEPDFNEDPFSLGAYDEIAHYHGGRGKRAKSFSVGFALPIRGGSGPARSRAQASALTTVVGDFVASGGQPVLRSVTFKKAEWLMRAESSEDKTSLHFETDTGVYDLRFGPQLHSRSLSSRSLFFLFDLLNYRSRVLSEPSFVEGTPPPQEELNEFVRLFSRLRNTGMHARKGSRSTGRPIAIAPIRTKPKRTYDRLREDRSPEGDHTPMLLARLSEADASQWRPLADALSAYGRSSGLFNEVVVRRFGGREASPFQLRVRLEDQHKEVNLVDVGYGVSQVLPILVDCLVQGGPGFFLMQQPEVHLHPRAQAELGSFLVQAMLTSRHRFVVETHSDYVVDRVRIAIREGTIEPGAVSLLFFERGLHGVRVHNLGLDRVGNLVEPPPGYRKFFLQEEIRFIR